MIKVVKKEGQLFGYGFRNGQPVELREDEDFELRWFSACTDVRKHNQEAQYLRIAAKKADKKRAKRQRTRFLLKFCAWQGFGSLVSALLLCAAVWLGMTVGWLAAVLPVTAALFLQQEVGRRTL